MNAFPSRLDLVKEEEGARVVIRARGELDLLTSEQLATMLKDGASAKDDVVIDLRGVTFVDCAGLRVLRYETRRAELDGYRLHLIRGSKAVERLLTLIGADARLPFVYDDDSRK